MLRIENRYDSSGERCSEDQGNLPTFSLDTVETYGNMIMRFPDANGPAIALEVLVYFQVGRAVCGCFGGA